MQEIGEHGMGGQTQRKGAALSVGMASPTAAGRTAGCIEVALVTMMPDAALARTERQFAKLFAAAAGERTILWRKFALPGVPLTPSGLAYLRDTYGAVEDLWTRLPDALVITGAEPTTPNMADEPYWPALTRLLDAAARLGIPMLLSCLSAHAAVRHFSGIHRRALRTKCCGVFDHVCIGGNLATGSPPTLRVVHSRWNEVDEADLLRAGYEVLLRSPVAGAGMFARDSMLFCQGHPEYDTDSLLAEYRRDVGRYLNFCRQTYPNPPAGYFGAAALAELSRFRRATEKDRDPQLLQSFPYEWLRSQLDGSWQLAASPIMQNWLARICGPRRAATVA